MMGPGADRDRDRDDRRATAGERPAEPQHDEEMVDEAGAIAAMRHAQRPCVTVAIDSMTFRQPVHMGELLMCDARVTYVGRSSIEVSVRVTAENPITSAVSHTNSAHLVYVAIGDDGRPAQVTPLELETEEDHRAHAEGELRQRERLVRAQRESAAQRTSGS